MSYASLDSPEARAKLGVPEPRKAKSRELATMPYANFEKCHRALGTTASELAERLGYARNTHHGWAQTGRMPAVAAKLCQAWVAALSHAQPDQTLPVLVARPQTREQLSWLRQTLPAMGIRTAEIEP